MKHCNAVIEVAEGALYVEPGRVGGEIETEIAEGRKVSFKLNWKGKRQHS